MDFAEWADHPTHPLDKRLCAPKHLSRVIGHILDNMDEFMKCPDTFSFAFEIIKSKLHIK